LHGFLLKLIAAVNEALLISLPHSPAGWSDAPFKKFNEIVRPDRAPQAGAPNSG
jgi:hypothetical protein